jgi:hypothetical protein
MQMLPLAQTAYGPSGIANLLGYSFTYVTAALAVSRLKAPRIGSRMPLHLRDHLVAYGRPELYDAALAVLGVAEIDRTRAEACIEEAAPLFDLAVGGKQHPHPFGHKLHPHLRPYFLEACAAMVAEGHHREALAWATPFYLASVDVILADGPEAEKPAAAAQRDAFLSQLGVSTVEECLEKAARAGALHEAMLALADKNAGLAPHEDASPASE